MTTKFLKNENSISGPLGSPKKVVDDALFKIVQDTDHRRLKEARSRTQEDIRETKEDCTRKSDQVAEYVMQCLRSAKQHKQAICEEYNQRESLRLKDNRYTELELALIGGAKTAVFFPLTQRLCRNMAAFLQNVMTRDEDNPNWTLTPTPIPELPKEDADEAANLLADQILSQFQLGFTLSEADIIEEMDRIAGSLMGELREEADRKAAKMTTYIRDLLERADIRTVTDRLFDDAVTYGTGIIKSPYVEAVWQQTYDGGNDIKTQKAKSVGARNVDVNWFFPSPDSCTTQDGSFIIEVNEMSIRQLDCAKNLVGFVPKNIELVLAELEEGDGMNWLRDMDNVGDITGKKEGMVSHGSKVRVVEFHGSMPGRKLAGLGVTSIAKGKIDPDLYYEVEIFVCNDVVIRAVENVNPAQKRPYHKMNLFPRTGAFWGVGVPMAIRDIQRVANAAYRSLVRNMGFASAPIWELDHGMWETDVSKPATEIDPNMIIDKNSITNPHNGNALTIHEIRSRGGEFLSIIAQLIEHAEMTIGMPRFLQGDPSGGGGAARTLGGLSTLQANANVGLRAIVADIDRNIMRPMIEMIYRWVLCTTDDPDLKGDAQVVVMGATQQLQRELNRDQLLQTVGVLLPFVEMEYIKPEGVSTLLREVVRDVGLDPDDVVIDRREAAQNQERLAALAQQAGGISGGVASAAQSPNFGPGGAAQTTAPAPPQVPLPIAA